MRSSGFLHAILVISIVSMVMACHKENSSAPTVSEQALIGKANKAVTFKQLKGSFDASYYIDFYGMMDGIPGFFYPATMRGNMTLLGKTTGYVNMFTYIVGQDTLSKAGSIKPYFSDQITGLGIQLEQIPDSIAILLADKQGNTIWARGQGDLHVRTVNDSIGTFGGYSVIAGGTGKFKNASGHFLISGQFNMNNFNDAHGEISEGEITYKGEE